jgi:tetratricopeptide (TPR) repeat protein
MVTGNIGALAYLQGDARTAEAMLTESLAGARRFDDRLGIASILNNLGNLAQERGDLERASACHEESLALRQQLGDRSGIATSLANLGTVARMRGDVERALSLKRAALCIRRDLEDKPGIAVSLEGLAQVAAAAGDHPRAARWFGAAAARLADAGIPLPLPYHDDHDRFVAAARVALDEHEYAVAWAVGHALPPAQAIAEALAAAVAAPSSSGRMDTTPTNEHTAMSDAQWEAVSTLLPPPPRRGRPRSDDRRVLNGILFVLSRGCRWRDLPPGYGSYTTAWQRYRTLLLCGAWPRIVAALDGLGYPTASLPSPPAT